MAWPSSRATRCTLPLTPACMAALPISSMEVSRPVTALMTSGPVMNMRALVSVMMMKSIKAGE